MTPCLAPEEFVDLADGTLSPTRRRHVDECAECRATAAEMHDALRVLADDEVPEPPAYFWASLNARVRAETAAPRSTWQRWLPWPAVVPVAAAVGLLLVWIVPTRDSAVGVHNSTPTLASDAADAADALDVTEDREAALALVVGLSQALPDGGWESLGVTNLPELAEAADLLSVEERAALVDLLRAAVDRPKS